MSRHTIVFASDTTKNFVANSRRGSEYNATIQNLTDQAITITVTNDDIQSSSPTFDTPAQGALAIVAGAVGALTEPYDGWLLTGGAPATGNVVITEAG